MTTTNPFRACVVLGWVLACAGSHAQAATKPPPTAKSVAWLAGCWAYQGAEPGSGETWMPAAGGSLLSVARRIEGGKLASWEFQRVVEQGGTLAFVVAPSGEPEAAFPLKSLTTREVVFERAEDVFPKRVIYRLAQNGNISARIEGGGAAQAMDFPMKRTNCERARRS
jgi:hypothetical protein